MRKLDRRKRIRKVAFHEAGHAIAAHAVGYRVERVEVFRSGRGACHTYAPLRSRTTLTRRSAYFLFRRLAVYWAGLLAEVNQGVASYGDVLEKVYDVHDGDYSDVNGGDKHMMWFHERCDPPTEFWEDFTCAVLAFLDSLFVQEQASMDGLIGLLLKKRCKVIASLSGRKARAVMERSWRGGLPIPRKHIRELLKKHGVRAKTHKPCPKDTLAGRSTPIQDERYGSTVFYAHPEDEEPQPLEFFEAVDLYRKKVHLSLLNRFR